MNALSDGTIADPLRAPILPDYRSRLPKFARRITAKLCLSSRLHVWFCENGMALNPSKSDAILFGTAQRLKTMSSLTSVKIADSAIQLVF